jgi:hypothetical protein
MVGYRLGTDVLSFGLRVLQIWRKRDPELEALDLLRRTGGGFLTVPHTTSGTHPLNAAVAEGSVTRPRIVERRITLGEHRDRRDARMRMHWHATRQSSHVRLEEVEKHKRLEFLAQICRAHQADDRAVGESFRPMNDVS